MYRIGLFSSKAPVASIGAVAPANSVSVAVGAQVVGSTPAELGSGNGYIFPPEATYTFPFVVSTNGVLWT